MTDLTARLAELKAVAEKATPGPWRIDPYTGSEETLPVVGKYILSDSRAVADNIVLRQLGCSCCDVGLCGDPADGRHIATFDPPTVLALIAAVEGVVALIDEHARREAHNEALSISDIADLLPEPTSEEYRRAIAEALGVDDLPATPREHRVALLSGMTVAELRDVGGVEL